VPLRFACLLLLCLAASCSDDVTELVVVVASDLAVPAEIDAITVKIEAPSGAIRQTSVPLFGSGSITLPATLALYPTTNVLGPVRIEGVATVGGSEVVTRTIRTSFVPGQRRMVVLWLSRGCVGVTCSGADETCVGGGCEPIDVPSESLPPWTGVLPALGDGGVEGGMDGGPTDGGRDAGPLVEAICSDGADNDTDGTSDCADSDCNGRLCSARGVCVGGICVEPMETNCANGADDDGDALSDCNDSDCTGRACGSSGVCVGGSCSACSVTHEDALTGDCGNGADDDCDSMTDCADGDCDGEQCSAGAAYCLGGLCYCTGGERNETGEHCRDRRDNDCDGASDCSDPDCVGSPYC